MELDGLVLNVISTGYGNTVAKELWFLSYVSSKCFISLQSLAISTSL